MTLIQTIDDAQAIVDTAPAFLGWGHAYGLNVRDGLVFWCGEQVTAEGAAAAMYEVRHELNAATKRGSVQRREI